MKREDCLNLDRSDPLAPFRSRFKLPQGVIYLDGNSLGAIPVQTPGRLQALLEKEWGEGLIGSWTAAGWIEAPSRIGDKIARLIGASPGEVIVTDSTSVDLFKLLAAAVAGQPSRHFIVTEDANFPTDLYVAQGIAELGQGRHVLRVVERENLLRAVDESVAVVMLTHVDYASGFVHDMAAITDAAHRSGALMLWDLSHSAGALPIDLNGCRVDLAVGCGYKYLNGGPGAPAYLFVAKHLQDSLKSPITGWMGHADPFAFDGQYRPAPGVKHFLSGTPPILAMTSLESAIDLWLEVDMQQVRGKSVALTELFIDLLEDRCAGFDLKIASPREGSRRGSQVSVRHANGYPIMRALIDRGVIGDFRPPDLMRFGFAPLYVRYADAWDAVEVIRSVLAEAAWQQPRYADKLAVT